MTATLPTYTDFDEVLKVSFAYNLICHFKMYENFSNENIFDIKK